MPKLASPPIYCRGCNQPLIEINVNHHCGVFCNNHQCRLFRERQGSRVRPPEPAPIQKVHPKPFNLLKPSYLTWLEKRKTRYRFARDLDFGSKRAMDLRGTTIEEIKKLARKEVRLPNRQGEL